MPEEKPAILFVGHGSRDNEAVDEFKKLETHFRAAYPERKVAYGFLEFANPIIADGIDELTKQGATQITAIPGMLMAAMHAKNDIPSELNQLQKEKNVSITYGSELGVSANMLQAAKERIEEAEAGLGDDYDRKDTLLVVVGRGASDPDANANICKITRFLEEGMGFGWSNTCFSGVTTPLVPEALDKIKTLGFKRLIIFPYFMFTGRLVKKIYQWADEFQADNPEIDVVKAPYLNDHPLVLEAFKDMLDKTENGHPNMNCQLCQYRVQIVGQEHKIGTPQESHHHHVQGIGTDGDHHHHDHDHHHHHHSHDD
ncbi:MAG: sirohydrochlorin chelatase [Methylococcales bacterium]|jgi:sirohydrochlorin cobaltochelatase|nr:sirohydrochlorin chelatase [Methylococcales bacterium]